MSSQVVGGAADTMSCLYLLMLVCFHVWPGAYSVDLVGLELTEILPVFPESWG